MLARDKHEVAVDVRYLRPPAATRGARCGMLVTTGLRDSLSESSSSRLLCSVLFVILFISSLIRMPGIFQGNMYKSLVLFGFTHLVPHFVGISIASVCFTLSFYTLLFSLSLCLWFSCCDGSGCGLVGVVWRRTAHKVAGLDDRGPSRWTCSHSH